MVRTRLLREVRRGFTVIELVVVIIVGLLIVAILVPATGRAKCCVSTQIRDGTQVRGIHQGMVLFAQNNGDKYPLPSLLDVENHTINAPAETKDTTSNIISILIWQNFFTPELCVSPRESNPAIRIDNAYEYEKPKAAVDAAQALWDPGFNADFTAANPTRVAGFSYGHRLPVGKRLKGWDNSFSSNDAIVANRGPKISEVKLLENGDVQPTFDHKSNTLLIHGGRSTWEGNVAYNDNSIQFETSLAPENKTWSERPEEDTSGRQYKSWRDVLFFDEPQDPNGINNYLVNIRKAGAGMELIWD